MAIAIETGVLLPYLGIGAAAGSDSAKQFLQLGSVIGRPVTTVIRKVFDHCPDKNLQNLQETNVSVSLRGLASEGRGLCV